MEIVELFDLTSPCQSEFDTKTVTTPVPKTNGTRQQTLNISFTSLDTSTEMVQGNYKTMKLENDKKALYHCCLK